MTRKYEVIREGIAGECADYGGSYETLKAAIWEAKEAAKRLGGVWIVRRRSDGKVVWRPGMSYEDALRSCMNEAKRRCIGREKKKLYELLLKKPAITNQLDTPEEERW